MRQKQGVFSLFLLSPSSRRAWIEICWLLRSGRKILVALLAEGVDRNIVIVSVMPEVQRSPSSRRAWIEIKMCCKAIAMRKSPSSRRAWIEIFFTLLVGRP